MLANMSEDEFFSASEIQFSNEVGKMIHQTVTDSVGLGGIDVPCLLGWLNKCVVDLGGHVNG
jgi:hypothetical protein